MRRWPHLAYDEGVSSSKPSAVPHSWETVPLQNLTALAAQGAVMIKKTLPIRSSVTSALKGTRNDGDGNAVHNRILLGLPNKECDFVLSKLILVNLELHDLLQEAGQPIQHCYFPNTAMASILNVMDNGPQC
jgi:hypothetical protein